jgi:hypothetical protein
MNEENIGQPSKEDKGKISLGIPEPEYPDIRPIIGEFLRDKGMHPSDVEGLAQAGGAVRHVQVIPPNIAKMMAMVATNAWKLKTKMSGGEEREIKEEWKRLYRHVDAIFENLADVGVEVKDRTGEPFDYGLPEKVITSHPTPGISRESVIETIRPTIYFNNQIIQRGEVVIATPETENPFTQSKE